MTTNKKICLVRAAKLLKGERFNHLGTPVAVLENVLTIVHNRGTRGPTELGDAGA